MIERAKAKERQLRKPSDSVPAMSQEQKGESSHKVAETIGMKPRKYLQMRHFYNAANDDDAPAPVREEAQRQMAALDAGETTFNAAERAVIWRIPPDHQTQRRHHSPAARRQGVPAIGFPYTEIRARER